ncbi:MAG: hypothetical protein IKX92_06445 [Clostridia bacterium]|nr:hypothetical protein [Clostridia bacterium]
MKSNKISEAIGGIDEKYICEAAEYSDAHDPQVAKTPRAGGITGKRRFAIAAAAACLAIVIAAGSAVGIIAEAKEYGEAVEFFEENGYSTEGLSRSEVKEIYRDIITQKFENEKTASVIRSKVSGTEISQDEPTPDEISSPVHTVSKNAGVTYTGEYKLRYDSQRGYQVPEKCFVECKNNGETLWKTEVEGAGAEGGVFHFDGGVYTSAGSAVWGRDCDLDYGVQIAQLARIDDSGSVLWAKTIDHGFGFEYVVTVLDNGDGTWEVFSHGDWHLCVSRYDSDGNETGCTQADIGKGSYLRQAARLGEGYIIQVVTDTSGDIASLYKLDGSGKITENFAYESDDCTYFITDMVEFGGQMYLSGYSVPYNTQNVPRGDEIYWGGIYEIANVFLYCNERYNEYKESVARGESEERDYADIVPSEELTPVMRDNYTAVLLICDAESGDQKTFYSVKGSRGGTLAVGGDRLDWNVNSITSSRYSPATNFYTIEGTCKVWRYSFNSDGELLGQADTGETDIFRR